MDNLNVVQLITWNKHAKSAVMEEARSLRQICTHLPVYTMSHLHSLESQKTDTWSLAPEFEKSSKLREKNAEDKVCPKREREVIGGWRKLDSEEPHNVHSTP